MARRRVQRRRRARGHGGERACREGSVSILVACASSPSCVQVVVVPFAVRVLARAGVKVQRPAPTTVSGSWFYARRCRNAWSARRAGPTSEGPVADDPGALHLAMARWVIHNRVVLRAAVVPERDAVRLPAEADLELGDVRLADQVAEQKARLRIRVLAEAHV